MELVYRICYALTALGLASLSLLALVAAFGSVLRFAALDDRESNFAKYLAARALAFVCWSLSFFLLLVTLLD